MKKWKSIVKHPLKQKKKQNALYIINEKDGLCMEMSRMKKGIRRFNKVTISTRELRLLKVLKLI